MLPLSSDLWLSFQRARNRRRLLLALASFGEAYVGQLSHATGIPPQRVRWMMHGHLPYYAPDLALVALGLAEVVVTERGRRYRITSLGLRKARSIAASRRFGHMRANHERKHEPLA